MSAPNNAGRKNGVQLRAHAAWAAMWAICSVLLSGGVATAQTSAGRQPVEPTLTEINSQPKSCVVSVCMDIDFGDAYFRYYARDRVILLRHIPRGTCSCQSVRSGDRAFNSQITFSVETPAGKKMPNVNLLRIFPPGHPRANPAYRSTTSDRFLHLQKQGELEEVTDFTVEGESFGSFRIFRDRKAVALGSRKYFFVPRSDDFQFQGRTQPIVFYTPLGYRDGLKEIRVTARVRLSDGIHLYQFFNPRITPAKDWISSIELSAEMVDARLIPKSNPDN
jgi:hypothetical protein